MKKEFIKDSEYKGCGYTKITVPYAQHEVKDINNITGLKVDYSKGQKLIQTSRNSFKVI